jgi:hypothetical protein
VVELLQIKLVSKESERLSESHCTDRCGAKWQSNVAQTIKNRKDYRNRTALIVVAQNGKANVAQTIISSKSEAWKRRMDRKQNSLHVAARPM